MDWDSFSSPSALYLNDNMTRAEVHTIMDEWETKCYLANPHFRNEPIHKYVSKEAIFASREALIKSICEREPKDETDTFVLQEYERFLKGVDQQTGSLTRLGGRFRRKVGIWFRLSRPNWS